MIWTSPDIALPVTPQYAYVDRQRASGSSHDADFGPLEEKLDSLGDLKPDWDGYGAEVPATVTLRWARLALLLLRDMHLCPTGVKPSARGGAVLCFDKNPQYASLEFFNSGDIVLLMARRPGPPKARQVGAHFGPIQSALTEISNFVSA